VPLVFQASLWRGARQWYPDVCNISFFISNQAKLLDGMDKHYDGHVWTKTQTTNITNDFGFSFRSCTCVGHLQCQNLSCDYLQRAHRTSKVKGTEFEGLTKDHNLLSGIVPSGFIFVCRICKEPPKCIALCEAKIFYVHGEDSSQRACIHIDTHQHPVNVGNCRDSRKWINAFIKEHAERTPQATYNKIVPEASKAKPTTLKRPSPDDGFENHMSCNEIEEIQHPTRAFRQSNL
jgi:hypothetical protein